MFKQNKSKIIQMCAFPSQSGRCGECGRGQKHPVGGAHPRRPGQWQGVRSTEAISSQARERVWTDKQCRQRHPGL